MTQHDNNISLSFSYLQFMITICFIINSIIYSFIYFFKESVCLKEAKTQSNPLLTSSSLSSSSSNTTFKINDKPNQQDSLNNSLTNSICSSTHSSIVDTPPSYSHSSLSLTVNPPPTTSSQLKQQQQQLQQQQQSIIFIFYFIH